MPRRERPIDPAAGPVARFAHELRELRNRAGRPTYRAMQGRGHASYASLSRAAAGRKLPTWPVTRGFVIACGADPDEWLPRWEAARQASSHPNCARIEDPPPLPDPATVHTVAELRTAVAGLLRDHDVGVVSAAMRQPLSTVREACRWPEQLELQTFQIFLLACGVPAPDIPTWTAAWRAVVATMRQPRPEPPEAQAPEAQAPGAPGAVPPPAHPDPAQAQNYDGLLAALRAVRVAAGISPVDIERQTGGRLGAGRAAAILEGAAPAGGEEWVLLLRACGLREEVRAWVDAWGRLDGATAGADGKPARLRGWWPAGLSPAGPSVLLFVLAPLTLLTVLLALLVG